MSQSTDSVLDWLLTETMVTALGTVADDGPYVSLTPFAVAPGRATLVVHLSGLAAHTRRLARDPRVSLLVAEAPRRDQSPLALARVTMQGVARVMSPDDPDYAVCRTAYLRRIPDAEPLFSFGDFRLYAIEITSARLVAGFAQASTLTAADIAAATQEL